MRIVTSLAGVIVLTGALVGTANAGIVYQFSATATGELNASDLSVVAAADRLYASGTLLTATFSYDPDVAAGATNVDLGVVNPVFAAYGLFSIYDDAITSVSGSVSGTAFGSSTANVLVGDSDGSSDPLDGFFGVGTAADAGWMPVSVGDFALTSYTLFTVGLSSMLADQSLPAEWALSSSLPGGLNSGMNLLFASTTGGPARIVQFHGSVTLAQVPEPGTLALLLGGLMGLVCSRRLQR